MMGDSITTEALVYHVESEHDNFLMSLADSSYITDLSNGITPVNLFLSLFYPVEMS